MISVIPCNDQNQALRVRRFQMALSSYVMCQYITTYCNYNGWFRM